MSLTGVFEAPGTGDPTLSLTGGRSEKENNRRIKKFKEAGGKMLRNS